MTRTALLAMAAAIGLSGPVRALAAPDGSVRTAALEALAAKADLPAARPVLPSLLTDPDAARPDGRGDARADSRGTAPGLSRGEAKKAARDAAAAEAGNAAAASGEAAKAAGQANADAHRAAEKKHEAKTRKDHPKPPHPPHGGG